jgi:hypothetical protein
MPATEAVDRPPVRTNPSTAGVFDSPGALIGKESHVSDAIATTMALDDFRNWLIRTAA